MSTLRRTLQRLRIDRSRTKDEKRQREEEEQADRWLKQDEEAKERMMREAEENFRLKVAEDSVTEYGRQKDLEDVKYRGIWETMLEARKVAKAEPVVMDVDFSNDGFEYADFEAYGMVRYHMFGEDIVSHGPDESVQNKIPSNLYGSKHGRHPYIIPDEPESTVSGGETVSQLTGDFESKLSAPLRQSTPFEERLSRSPPLTDGCYDETDFEFSSENLILPAFQSATPKSGSIEENYRMRPATASRKSENLTEEDHSPRCLTSYHSCFFAVPDEDEATDKCSVLPPCSEDSSDTRTSFSPNWTPVSEPPSPVSALPICQDDRSSSRTSSSFSPSWKPASDRQSLTNVPFPRKRLTSENTNGDIPIMKKNKQEPPQ